MKRGGPGGGGSSGSGRERMRGGGGTRRWCAATRQGSMAATGAGEGQKWAVVMVMKQGCG